MWLQTINNLGKMLWWGPTEINVKKIFGFQIFWHWAYLMGVIAWCAVSLISTLFYIKDKVFLATDHTRQLKTICWSYVAATSLLLRAKKLHSPYTTYPFPFLCKDELCILFIDTALPVEIKDTKGIIRNP